MSVRFLAALLAGVLLLTGCAARRETALDARMERFLAAVRAEDAAAFAEMFPSRAPWRFVLNADVAGPDGVRSSRQVTEVTPERLRRDLATRGEYHSYFLDPGNRGVGSIGWYAAQGEPWRRVAGNRFVPAGSGEVASTWVSWREEGGRWVVDEIAEWYH